MPNIQLFDYSVNVIKCILWQYEDATALRSLIQSEQDWIDVNHTQFWESWVTDVFDLRTANNFGMAVWAVILDIPLTFELDPQYAKEGFGFGQYRKRFDHGNFRNTVPIGVNLTLAQKRLALRLRYFQICTSGAIAEINEFMNYLFNEELGMGNVYVRNSGVMEIEYVFDFVPSSQTQVVLDQFDLLPRPCGVSLSIVTP